MVAGSEGARIGGVELPPGTTIFSGDRIDVGHEGFAELAIAGGGLALVGANSSLGVESARREVALDLVRGQAALRLVPGKVEGRMLDATVRATGGNAQALLLWTSDTRAIIGAEKGVLEIRAASTGRTVTLREGEAIEATVSPVPAPAEGSALSRNGVIILSAVIIGLASIVGVTLSRTLSKPSEQQRRDAVSPFRFP